MSRIYFIILLGLSYNISFGQHKTMPKLIVNLHDNSTYIGHLVAEGGYKIDMLISTGDTIQISRLMVKDIIDSRSDLVFDQGKYLRSTGYFWSMGLGSNFADDAEDGCVSSHLELLFGHRINSRFNAGFGVGFEFNEAQVAGFEFDTQFGSIFLYGRTYLTNHSRRLFAFTRLGYGGAAEEETEFTSDHTGGYQAQLGLGLGLHFASKDNSKFQLQLAQHFQETQGVESFVDILGTEIVSEFDIIIKRILLKFVWEFK